MIKTRANFENRQLVALLKDDATFKAKIISHINRVDYDPEDLPEPRKTSVPYGDTFVDLPDEYEEENLFEFQRQKFLSFITGVDSIHDYIDHSVYEELNSHAENFQDCLDEIQTIAIKIIEEL